ncbi:MAG: energy transducer TonB [Alistipes sp.]|nr:energy transducer TonB [Alistipes sp.]
MKEFLTYFYESAICGGVLFAIYVGLLERRTPFRWCRAFLLGSVVLAAVIPLLRIPVWPGPVLTAMPFGTADFSESPVAFVETQPVVDVWGIVCRTVYWLGVAVVSIPMLRQLLLLRRIRRTAQISFADDYTLVRTLERIEACSFFRTIYVWQGTPDDELPVILLHERSHIRHRHSFERVAMETMKVVLWWNPFVWLVAGRLNEVEEFEADGDVLRSGYDMRCYMQIILKQLLGYSPDITNGLRNSRTKKRFIMMTTNVQHRHVLLRLAGVLPALIGLLCAFSFTARAARYAAPEAEPVIAGMDETHIAEPPASEEDAYLRVETMPVFRGGNLNDFRQWVQMQVRMPKEAVENRLQGRVVATFVIEKDGTLDGIRILQTPDRVFSEEVERVLKRSEKWTPGMQDGKAVRVKYILPIDFRLAGVEAPAEQGAAPEPSATTVPELVIVAYPKEDASAQKSVTVQVSLLKEGRPLAGALVQEMGTDKGTVTDADGKATIKTVAGRTLKVLSVGCATAYYSISKEAQSPLSVTISMLPSVSTETSADGAVTVSGYGTKPNDEKPILIVDDKLIEGGIDRLNEVVDVNDIENLSVLKSNGENAVVITTKSGAAKKVARK